MRKTALVCCLSILFSCCTSVHKKDHQLIEVQRTEQSPTIDGIANDDIWNRTVWHSIDQIWLGGAYSHEDFHGRYKLAWDSEALYMLVETTDDVLLDKTQDPLERYWDDDCLEIFIDADNSGGNHQYNHNAFAYHVALDGNVVDMATNKKPKLFNDHLRSAIVTEEQRITWEIALRIYPDTYSEEGENRPEALTNKEKMGFALAYCDNDRSEERENFIGSVFVPGEDKNLGWINADIFGTLVLKK